MPDTIDTIEPSEATVRQWPADYAALGIHRDTWACVNVGEKQLAMKALWDLALSGVPALVSRDADGKRYHVAVQGGLAGQPVAWINALRGEAYADRIVTCPADATGQHPQAVRDAS